MNKKKNTWSILGIIAGVTITIFGFVILCKKTKFGGDFYTEIYDIVRLGFGLLLLGLGVTDIFLFGRNLYECDSTISSSVTIKNSQNDKEDDDDDTLPNI